MLSLYTFIISKVGKPQQKKKKLIFQQNCMYKFIPAYINKMK